MPSNSANTLEQRLTACWDLGRTGKTTEGLIEAQRLLIEAQRANNPARVAHANRCIGWFCLQLGFADEGLTAAGEALKYYSGTDDLWGQSLSIAVYSWLLLELGLSDLSYESASHAADITARTDDQALNAFALNCKAIALTVCREHQLAEAMLSEALALAERSGDPSTLALTLVNSGYMMMSHALESESGAEADVVEAIYRKALAVNDRAVVVAREAGDLWNLRTALCNGVEGYTALGEAEPSHKYIEEWEKLPGRVGSREKIHYLYSKGDLYNYLNQNQEALEIYLEAARLANNTSNLEHRINTRRRLSDIKAKLGHFEEALELYRDFHAAYVSQGGEVSRRRAHALDIQMQNDKLREKAAELELQVGRDPLTGLPNRRSFDSAVSGLGAKKFCLAIVDLDHFKSVNDLYSHLVGDAVLRRVSDLLAGHDAAMQVYRLGGEEFALLFPGMDLPKAANMVDGAREKLAQARWDDLAHGLHVTASVGVAANERGLDFSKLMTIADRRLYRAKAMGRNCVVCTDRVEPASLSA